MTPRFAPVAPLAVHMQLDEAGLLGDYNLLIASEILKDPILYREFWQGRRSTEGLSPEILVDNGIIELGYPLPIAQLVKAIEIVNGTVLILPDTIDDAKMTMKQVRHTIVEWKRYGLPDIATLGVVQGITYQECLNCADSHAQSGVDWLAIPRGLPPNIGSRYDLTMEVGERFHLPIHLLGFTENIEDDIASARAHALVQGIDTATPVWLGMSAPGAELPKVPPKTANYGRRPEWFWQANRQEGGSMATIRYNVAQVRFWLDGDWAALRYLGRSDVSLARISDSGPAARRGRSTPI